MNAAPNKKIYFTNKNWNKSLKNSFNISENTYVDVPMIAVFAQFGKLFIPKNLYLIFFIDTVFNILFSEGPVFRVFTVYIFSIT
jgi:hypothetical protein